MMLRLNIRHALPQTAQQSRPNKLEKSAVIQAQLHGDFQQAQSNRGAAQPVTEINNYPSRRAWGARNMTDFTRERGQKGFADVREATSRKTQEAWDRAENDGKPGNNVIINRIVSETFSKYTATPVIRIEMMEPPEITVTPSRVVGEPSKSHMAPEIETAPFPAFSYTPGGAETYMKNEGFIRRWITMDKYDIYA